MSDTFSFTPEQMAGATAAGFADPRQQQAQVARDAIIADAVRRGDDCEARIFSGAVAAQDVPIEVRRVRAQVETMFSGNGLTPWHRLPEAKILPGTASSVEALEASGLNWTVMKLATQVIDEAWRTDEKVPSFALVRDTDKRVLGSGGRGYTVVQNQTLFAIGEALVRGGARWETAGSLSGGKRVWVLLSLDAEGETAPGDTTKVYLLISNAHGDAKTAEIALTTVRPVCNNSYTLALGSGAKAKFAFNHTKNVELKLAQAGEILLAAKERFDDYIKATKAMAAFKLTEQEQIDYLVKALGIDADPEKRTKQMQRKLDNAKLCLEAEKACASDGLQDSGWTAFNCVTRFTTHDARVNKTGGDAGKTLEKRLERATWGENARVNTAAFELMLARTQA